MPQCVEPVKYQIEFDFTHKLQNSFKANCKIYFNLASVTNKIILNVKDLTVEKVQLVASGVNIGYFVDGHNLNVIFDESLLPGDYILEFDYSGFFQPNLSGVYKSIYNNEVFITTHFEPDYAKFAFPCIDSPNCRSIYNLSFKILIEDMVISNTSIVDNVYLDERTKIMRFADTKPLPSYLIAFTIGKYFKLLSTNSISIWSNLNRADLAEFSIKLADFCLKSLNEYFNYKIDFNSLDLIAVPDLPFNGMENDGCIFFRQHSLLIDSSISNVNPSKLLVLDTITHEISHLWFGNLVGIASWSQLWLKEAVATMLQYKLINLYDNSLNYYERFCYAKQSALKIDGLNSTRAIEINNINNYEMFDTLTYQKGAQIIFWLENFIGCIEFKNILGKFINKYPNKSCEAEKFIEVIQETSSYDITSLYNSLIKSSGYDLISLTMLDKNTFKIDKNIFKYQYQENENFNQSPIILKIFSNNKFYVLRFLMIDRSAIFKAPFEIDFICLNMDGIGFYRSRYIDKISLFKLSKFNNKELICYLADSYALLINGTISWSDFKSILESCSFSTCYFLWQLIDDILCEINIVNDISSNNSLKRLLAKIISDNLSSLNLNLNNLEVLANKFDEYPYSLVILNIVSKYNLFDLDNIQLKSLFDSRFKNQISYIYLNQQIKLDDEKAFENCIDNYMSIDDLQTKKFYFTSLSNFCKTKHLNVLFDLILQDKIINSDISYLLKNLLLNPKSSSRTLKFILQNFAYLNKIINQSSISNIFMGLPGLAGSFKSIDEVNALHRFFQNYYNQNIPQQFKQYFELLNILYQFKNRENFS